LIKFLSVTLGLWFQTHNPTPPSIVNWAPGNEAYF
jgi:hypothetical protein